MREVFGFWYLEEGISECWLHPNSPAYRQAGKYQKPNTFCPNKKAPEGAEN